MEDQNAIMQGELDITRESIKQSDRALIASETMAKAAEESAKIAKESFYVGERPYFGLKHASLELEGMWPRLVIHFENGGRTPAWHFNAIIWLVFGQTPGSGDRKMFHLTRKRMDEGFYPAGNSKGLVFIAPKIEADTMSNIQDKKIRCFVVGTAHYSDMRREGQSFSFKGYYDPDERTLIDWETP